MENLELSQLVFKTAKENMVEDEKAFLSQNRAQIPYLRVYQWGQAGITYPEKRPLPITDETIDHAPRPTGGGAVFHNPGDVLLTLCIPIAKARALGGLKPTLHWVSEHHKKALAKHLQFDDKTCTKTTDILYCNAYHNPYEGLISGEKVMAIAARFYKSHLALQCVFHLQDHNDHFPAHEAWSKYYSKGPQQPVDSEGVKHTLEQYWKNLT